MRRATPPPPSRAAPSEAEPSQNRDVALVALAVVVLIAWFGAALLLIHLGHR